MSESRLGPHQRSPVSRGSLNLSAVAWADKFSESLTTPRSNVSEVEERPGPADVDVSTRRVGGAVGLRRGLVSGLVVRCRRYDARSGGLGGGCVGVPCGYLRGLLQRG